MPSETKQNGEEKQLAKRGQILPALQQKIWGQPQEQEDPEVRADRIRKEAQAMDDDVDAILEDNSKDLLAALEDAKTAKEEDWAEEDKDLWQPKENDEFVGIYLATLPGIKFKVHVFATTDSKGRLFKMRINGTHILTRELQKMGVGSTVRVRFLGQTGSSRGKLNMYSTKKLKSA